MRVLIRFWTVPGAPPAIRSTVLEELKNGTDISGTEKLGPCEPSGSKRRHGGCDRHARRADAKRSRPHRPTAEASVLTRVIQTGRLVVPHRAGFDAPLEAQRGAATRHE